MVADGGSRPSGHFIEDIIPAELWWLVEAVCIAHRAVGASQSGRPATSNTHQIVVVITVKLEGLMVAEDGCISRIYKGAMTHSTLREEEVIVTVCPH